jgi:hypothetical protein
MSSQPTLEDKAVTSHRRLFTFPSLPHGRPSTAPNTSAAKSSIMYNKAKLLIADAHRQHSLNLLPAETSPSRNNKRPLPSVVAQASAHSLPAYSTASPSLPNSATPVDAVLTLVDRLAVQIPNRLTRAWEIVCHRLTWNYLNKAVASVADFAPYRDHGRGAHADDGRGTNWGSINVSRGCGF